MVATLALDGQIASGPLFARQGGAFDSLPNDFEESYVVGQLTISFDACDHATVEYEIDNVTSGSFDIQPLDQFLGPDVFSCIPFSARL